jgi:hypothetical protein
VQVGVGRLRLESVVGVGPGGGVPSQTLATVTVNELSTVATAYALAQFSGPNGITGPSPGLENAAATAFNLANPASGKAGAVVTDQDNGAKNQTLAALGTLANLVSLCATAQSRGCGELLRLTTPPGGTAPANTVQAVVNLARNPTLAPAGLYALARTAKVYQPALTAPPTAWILVLLFTETDLYASGRIAIDAKGNVWSSNNWLPGTLNGSTFVTVLSPVGQPALGSPISGGGMKGGGWGIAIAPDGTAWVPAFGASAMSQYSPAGVPLSPSSGWTNGNLNHPQGDAVDQTGNVWIANNYGPESAPGQGNVVVYPGGDPSKAFTISGGGLNHPFAVQIDGYGRAWVTNAGPGGAKLVGTKAAILVGKFGGSITVIGPNFKPTSFSPIQSKSFKWPLGLAIDSKNNAWAANYFSSTVTQIRPDGTVAGVVQAAARHAALVGGHRRLRSRLGGRLRHPHRVAALRHRHRRMPTRLIHRDHRVPPAGVPERGVPAHHIHSARPVGQRLAEQQLVQAPPGSRRRGNRGDHRCRDAGVHPAHAAARTALIRDRDGVPAADGDAAGGRRACLFCHPDRRSSQRRPAERDSGLGVGCDRRRVCGAGGRRGAVLPSALREVVTCWPWLAHERRDDGDRGSSWCAPAAS